MIFYRQLWFVMLLFVLIACTGCPPKKVSDIPIIVVSTLPQSWFVHQIAGDRVQVEVLVGMGQNPHNYEPSPRQMAALAKAGVWVLSGTEFEIGLRPKIERLFPGLAMIDGTAGVRFRSLEAHADGDEDEEDGIDRHTWLGEEPALILAGHILEALIMADSAGADGYRENYAAVCAGISAEFARLRQELAGLSGTAVFVYHPAFGYFLDEFGIVQEAVETGGKEPTPRQLSALIEKARGEGARAIFVQAQFPVESARTVAAATGAELIALDPLAPDWLKTIQAMGEALKHAARP
jgi:zinc transport system substrate-binding protein